MALLLPWPAVVLKPVGRAASVGAFAEPGAGYSTCRRCVGGRALPFVRFAVMAFAAAAVTPNRSMLAGVAAVVLGGFAVIVLRTVSITPLPAAPPSPAGPAARSGRRVGLLWVVLAAFRRTPRVPFARVVSAVGVVAVVN
ncbi:hypothetical protein K7G98_21975 [Saccharothrix sp. MB29]|nr:hypothetical protein [Saccharothrix sp. MB29]